MSKRQRAMRIGIPRTLLVVTLFFVVLLEGTTNMAVSLTRIAQDDPTRGGPDTRSVGGSFDDPLRNLITGAHTAAPTAVAPTDTGGDYSGGDYSGGGGGSYDGSFYSAPTLTDDQWLAGDSGYTAQLAALQKALSDSNADYTAQKSKYDTNYNDSLKGLGWAQALTDDPNTIGVDESRPGAWNFQDQNTASGRAFQNQQNDFASRGLLQSSGYGTALDNLQRSLNDQLGSINTGRQSFLDDTARAQSAAQSQNTLDTQQARTEALQRRALGISLT